MFYQFLGPYPGIGIYSEK